MQFNDLSTYVEVRHVVTLTPTLFAHVDEGQKHGWRKWADLIHRPRPVSPDDYVLNELMVRWITSEGYRSSIATEIWGFPTESEELFDDLCERLLRVADRYIFRCTRWDSESDAHADMMANLPSITRIYDADPDRVDRLWQYNGYRVPIGGAP